MSTFEGRPVLITGGGTGMGRAFALALAERGAPVAVCGRRPDPIEETAELCRAHGVGALASQVDVRDPERVEAWVAEAGAARGPPRMLINNAAGNFLARAIDLSPNGWRAVVDIVLNGTFYCSTSVARSMRAAGVGGAILNVIASYAWTGNPMTAHSAAAKAGVWNLARSLAVEWAPLGIRVNCIAPGPLDSEGAAERLFPTPEIREKMLDDIPAHRFTTLDDVVASALFLLSDDAAHVTGETLTVDGGQSLSQGMFRHSPIPQRP
jgi:NAD(P)-dependent dehydrogenase (short-subunit alcohol dehydrogenase family)